MRFLRALLCPAIVVATLASQAIPPAAARPPSMNTEISPEGTRAANAAQDLRTGGATPCAPRDLVVDQLAQEHGEVPVAAGLVGPRGAIEVFVNRAGEFTVVFSDIRGLTCMIAAGQGWRRTRPLPGTAGH